MPILKIIGIISGVFAAISYIPYIADILRRKAKPERASWLIWSILFIIVTIAQYFEGARYSLIFTLFDGIGAFTIFVLSIKFGVGGLTKRDIRGLIAAAIGLLLWYLTSNPIFALILSIAVDGIAATLTVLKTFENPKSETYFMWSMVASAALLGMVAVGELNLGLLVYPFYIFLANFSVVVAKFIAEHSNMQRNHNNAISK